MIKLFAIPVLCLCGVALGTDCPPPCDLMPVKKSVKVVRREINTNCRVIHLDDNWGGIQKAIDKYGDRFEMRNP